MTDIEFSPSTLEVDYDKNLTELYKAITDQDWDTAIRVCRQDPDQAATWVVRHYEPEDGEDADEEELEIMWRFLPLHSACARQPPATVVTALLRAYADGAKCQDDQGMYALHYACGNQASRDVVRLLLVSYPEAAQMVDPRGMLPIHYLACWGPSSTAVVDMLLVANRNVSDIRDMDGNTPLDLAREGDYPDKDAVIQTLRKWTSNADHSKSNRSVSTKRSTQSKTSAHSSGNKTGNSGKSRKSSTSRSRSIQRKPSEDSYTSRRSRTASAIEEKKEDDLIIIDDLENRPVTSSEDVKRLQEELRSLRSERMSMVKKIADSKAKILELDEARETIKDQEKTIRELKEKLGSKMDLDDVTRTSEITASNKYAKELDDTKHKLKEAREELKGLRLTLTEMMDEHESQKKKSVNVNDRLSSLVYNIEAMMERQTTLQQAVKERRDKRKQILKERKEALKKLLEMEELSDDDSTMEIRFKKQTKEMEAIAAVINAARDD
jgi:hypothetical protein